MAIETNASAADNVFLQAMNILIKSEIDKLQTNQMIHGIISNIDQRDQNVYQVNVGGIQTYQAYASAGAKYELNDHVYLLDPDNNTTTLKLIAGPYLKVEDIQDGTVNTDQSIDSFINLTDNILEQAYNLAEALNIDQKPVLPQQSTIVLNKSLEDDVVTDLPINNMAAEIDLSRASATTLWALTDPQILAWYQKYERLLLQGDFLINSQLNEPLINGTYGLLLYITTKKIDEETGEGSEEAYWFNLSSEEMIGDPYQFAGWSTQYRIFNISELGQITGMELLLYQDGQFQTETSAQNAEHPYIAEDMVIVSVDNLIVAGGTEIETESTEDHVYFTTVVDKNYAVANDPKPMQVRWVHYENEESVEVIQDNATLPEGARVSLYLHDPTAGMVDKIAGENWVKQNLDTENSFSFVILPPTTMEKAEYKVVIELPAYESLIQNFIDTNDSYMVLFTLLSRFGDNLEIKRSDEKIYSSLTDLLSDLLYSGIDNQDDWEVSDYHDALTYYIENHFSAEIAGAVDDPLTGGSLTQEQLLEYVDNFFNAFTTTLQEHLIYESESVTFTYTAFDPAQLNENLIFQPTLILEDGGYNGVYNLYTEDGQMENAAEALEERSITATYQSLFVDNEKIDYDDTISWYFPLHNTMIQEPEPGHEYIEEIDSEGVVLRTERAMYLTAEDYQYFSFPCDYCKITRPVGSFIEDEIDDKGYFMRSASQVFRIKSFYNSSARNNTIYCRITKNGFSRTLQGTLSFGTAGIAGTKVTFYLEMKETTSTKNSNGTLEHVTIKDSNAAMLRPGECIGITPRLFDEDQHEITDYSSKEISYKWIAPSVLSLNADAANIYQPYVSTITGGNEKSCVLTLREGASIQFSDYRYYILAATASWTIPTYQRDGNGHYITREDEDGNSHLVEDLDHPRTLNFTTYLPIPVGQQAFADCGQVTSFSGPNVVVYDSFGKNPQYDHSAYSFTKTDGDILHTDQGLVVSSCDTTEFAAEAYPTINRANQLDPAQIYFFADEAINHAPRYSVDIIAPAKQTADNTEKLLYTQPILIHQNSYDSTLLTQWDGEFTIDNQNARIFAACIIAGHKNANNTFTGVVMGDVTGAVPDNESTQSSGLYGLKNGNFTFGLNTDGTAFLGGASAGRIEFDGTSGIIRSAADVRVYDPDKQAYPKGVLIDLQNGNATFTGRLTIGGYDIVKSFYQDLAELKAEGKQVLSADALYQVDTGKTITETIDNLQVPISILNTRTNNNNQNQWYGETTDLTTLRSGQQITFLVPANYQSNGDEPVTLQIAYDYDASTATYKQITSNIVCFYSNDNSQRLTDQYKENEIITLMYVEYESTFQIESGATELIINTIAYPINNNTITYNNKEYIINNNQVVIPVVGWVSLTTAVDLACVKHPNQIKAIADIAMGQLIVGDSATEYKPLIGNTTFSIDYPILFANTSISNTNSSTETFSTYTKVNLRRVLNDSHFALPANANVYVKGILDEQNVFTTVSGNPFTNTIDLEVDGYSYLLIGVMSSATLENNMAYQCSLLNTHPIFKYEGGEIQSLSELEANRRKNLEKYGGQNYLTDSSSDWVWWTPNTASASPSYEYTTFDLNDMDLQVGEFITCQITMQTEGFAQNSTATVKASSFTNSTLTTDENPWLNLVDIAKDKKQQFNTIFTAVKTVEVTNELLTKIDNGQGLFQIGFICTNLAGNERIGFCKLQLEKGKYATEWSPAKSYAADLVLQQYVQQIGPQLDGAIQFHTGEGYPTIDSAWTMGEKQNYKGDLYRDTISGILYQFEEIATNEYGWQVLQSDLFTAFTNANIDLTQPIYTTKPIPPYTVGSTWIDNKEMYVCIVARAEEEQYQVEDWQPITEHENLLIKSTLQDLPEQTNTSFAPGVLNTDWTGYRFEDTRNFYLARGNDIQWRSREEGVEVFVPLYSCAVDPDYNTQTPTIEHPYPYKYTGTSGSLQLITPIYTNGHFCWGSGNLPTEKNDPAGRWKTTQQKQDHIGDLYLYNTSNIHNLYQWTWDQANDSYSWTLLNLQDVTDIEQWAHLKPYLTAKKPTAHVDDVLTFSCDIKLLPVPEIKFDLTDGTMKYKKKNGEYTDAIPAEWSKHIAERDDLEMITPELNKYAIWPGYSRFMGMNLVNDTLIGDHLWWGDIADHKWAYENSNIPHVICNYDTWTRVYITVKPHTSKTMLYQMLECGILGNRNRDVLYSRGYIDRVTYDNMPRYDVRFMMRNAKLEFGDHATEWTASSKDLDIDLQKTVQTVTVQYRGSASATELTTGQLNPVDSNQPDPETWQTVAPKWQQGQYMWSRQKITYLDGTIDYSKEVCISGATGQGLQIINNYYTVTDSDQTAPTISNTSIWTGPNPTVIPKPSVQNPYLWNYEVIKYTNGDETVLQPHIIGHYGQDGTASKTVSITASSQIFKQNRDESYSPANITLTPTFQGGLEYSHWAHNLGGADLTQYIASDTHALTIPASFLGANTSATFTCHTTDSNYVDKVTILRLSDGEDGTSPYNILFNNEAVIFETDVNSNFTESQEFTLVSTGYYGSNVTYDLNISTATGLKLVDLNTKDEAIILSNSATPEIGSDVAIAPITYKNLTSSPYTEITFVFPAGDQHIPTNGQILIPFYFGSNSTEIIWKAFNYTLSPAPKEMAYVTEYYAATEYDTMSKTTSGHTQDLIKPIYSIEDNTFITGYVYDYNETSQTGKSFSTTYPTEQNNNNNNNNNPWDAAHPFLWRYEITTFTDGSTSAASTPIIISRISRELVEIRNFYTVTTTTNTPSTDNMINENSGWIEEKEGNTLPIPDANNPYLWNCEIMIYSDSYKTLTPHIIGHFGKDGNPGTPGEIAPTINVVCNTSTAIKRQVDTNDLSSYVYTPSIVPFSANCAGNIYKVKWLYKYNTDSAWRDIKTDVATTINDTLTTSNCNLPNAALPGLFASGVTSVTVRCEGYPYDNNLNANSIDTITVYRLDSGKTVILENEAQIIPANSKGEIIAPNGIDLEVNIQAYEGEQLVNVTIDTSDPLDLPIGITVKSYTTNQIIFTAAKTNANKTNLVTDDAINIPILFPDGTVINKTLTYTVSKAPKDVIGYTEYYLLSNQDSGILNTNTEFKTKAECPNSKIPVPTSTNKYLWCYEIKHYSDGTDGEKSDPHIISIFGEKGDQGIAPAQYITQFCSIPSQYTLIKGTAGAVIVKEGNTIVTYTVTWDTAEPNNLSSENTVWTRTKIIYTDNTTTEYTTPQISRVLSKMADVEQQAQDAKTQATKVADRLDNTGVQGRNYLLRTEKQRLDLVPAHAISSYLTKECSISSKITKADAGRKAIVSYNYSFKNVIKHNLRANDGRRHAGMVVTFPYSGGSDYMVSWPQFQDTITMPDTKYGAPAAFEWQSQTLVVQATNNDTGRVVNIDNTAYPVNENNQFQYLGQTYTLNEQNEATITRECAMFKKTSTDAWSSEISGRIAIPFTIPTRWNGNTPYFAFQCTFPYAEEIRLYDAKLEFGSIDTGWIKAPEDEVKLIDIEFCQSTSKTALTGSEIWTTDAPSYKTNYYIWSRQHYYYADGSHEPKPATCITAMDAKSVHISANATAFLENDTSTAYTPTTITLTPRVHGELTLKEGTWYYSQDNGITFTQITTTGIINSTTKVLTVAYGNTTFFNTNKSCSFKYSITPANDTTYYDVITLSKLQHGKEGVAACTINLDNENETIGVGTNGTLTFARTITVTPTILEGRSDRSSEITTISFTTIDDALWPSSSTHVTATQTGKKAQFVFAANQELQDGAIKLHVTFKRLDNSTLTLTKIFTYTIQPAPKDGADAQILNIEQSAFAFQEDDEGNRSPNIITLTPTAQGFASTPTYEWYYKQNNSTTETDFIAISLPSSLSAETNVNGITLASNGTLSIAKTTTLFSNTENSVSFKCCVSESDIYDRVTVLCVKDGVANYHLECSNQKFDVAVDNDGKVLSPEDNSSETAVSIPIRITALKGTTTLNHNPLSVVSTEILPSSNAISGAVESLDDSDYLLYTLSFTVGQQIPNTGNITLGLQLDNEPDQPTLYQTISYTATKQGVNPERIVEQYFVTSDPQYSETLSDAVKNDIHFLANDLNVVQTVSSYAELASVSVSTNQCVKVLHDETYADLTTYYKYKSRKWTYVCHEYETTHWVSVRPSSVNGQSLSDYIWTRTLMLYSEGEPLICNLEHNYPQEEFYNNTVQVDGSIDIIKNEGHPNYYSDLSDTQKWRKITRCIRRKKSNTNIRYYSFLPTTDYTWGDIVDADLTVEEYNAVQNVLQMLKDNKETLHSTDEFYQVTVNNVTIMGGFYNSQSYSWLTDQLPLLPAGDIVIVLNYPNEKPIFYKRKVKATYTWQQLDFTETNLFKTQPSTYVIGDIYETTDRSYYCIQASSNGFHEDDWEPIEQIERDIWIHKDLTNKELYRNDLYVDTLTSNVYRYVYNPAIQDYDWEIVNDKSLMQLAYTTNTVYTDMPQPPYQKGDLWIRAGENSEETQIFSCEISRAASEQFSASDWTAQGVSRSLIDGVKALDDSIAAAFSAYIYKDECAIKEALKLYFDDTTKKIILTSSTIPNILLTSDLIPSIKSEDAWDGTDIIVNLPHFSEIQVVNSTQNAAEYLNAFTYFKSMSQTAKQRIPIYLKLSYDATERLYLIDNIVLKALSGESDTGYTWYTHEQKTREVIIDADTTTTETVDIDIPLDELKDNLDDEDAATDNSALIYLTCVKAIDTTSNVTRTWHFTSHYYSNYLQRQVERALVAKKITDTVAKMIHTTANADGVYYYPCLYDWVTELITYPEINNVDESYFLATGINATGISLVQINKLDTTTSDPIDQQINTLFTHAYSYHNQPVHFSNVSLTEQADIQATYFTWEQRENGHFTLTCNNNTLNIPKIQDSYYLASNTTPME